jgi:hypothetical protein
MMRAGKVSAIITKATLFAVRFCSVAVKSYNS